MIGALRDHARAIVLAAILLTLAGIGAALRLPVSLFPHIDYPRVVVSVEAGDREPAQMAAEITRPIEIALRQVPGVTRIRSTTSRGSAEVGLNFAWGDDMVAGTLATQGALATALPDLPPGTRFSVRRSDPTIFPVLGIALTSKSLDPATLRQIAELQIRPALSSVAGVAGVDVLGSAPREIAVDLDPGRLQALGISLSDVATAVGRASMVRGVGRVEDRHRLYLVLVENRATSIEDIGKLPVKAASAPPAGAGPLAGQPMPPPSASVVTLGQIASIHPATAPNFTRVTSGGRDAILVNVRQSLTGDSVAIVRAVDARLAQIHLPPTVSVTPFYDQSELVTGAANAVRDAILLGALLAGLVLFLFLRSFRLMAITGIALPAVLAATCLLLLALNMGFNMMTLGGMAAAVGLVVDDAVVMLEHMMRRMQEGAARDRDSLLAAAAEMGKPLYGSSLATIIIFLPLAFVSGVTGGFFKALALTMAAALILSLLYARFVIPLVAAAWLRPKDVEAAGKADRLMQRLERGHDWAERRTLGRPRLFVGIVAIAMLGLGYLAWTKVPSGFMPAMDEGGFVLDYKAQPGAALSDTDRILRQVEQIITATPEVASYSRRTGVQLGGGLTEADEGDYFIRLKGGSRRPIDAVMTDIRTQIEAKVPGLQIETIQLMEDLIGDLTAVPQPIEVKLFSDDPVALNAAAKRVGDAIGKIPGVVEVVNGLRVAGDAIDIRVRPGALAQQGMDADAFASQIEGLIGGTEATRMRAGEQLLAVRVRAPADLRQRAAQIAQLPLVAPDGHGLTVGQVADVGVQAGQQQLTREDLAPFVAVTARLEGRDLGSGMKDVRKTVGDLRLPGSVRVDYGGLYAEQQKSFADLSMVFAAALLLTALLLTILFERIAWTLAAILTVLLSAAAVLIGLWVTGIELNISALMGLTMVVGMVTELVIFYLAELDPAASVGEDALREAGRKRLRPILMSALIAVLTLSPLALGLSRGAGLQQPLATAIIFGLTAAVPLVLLFLPGALLIFGDKPRPARDAAA
ncbi:efflux RND transporter permease subunit [Sphingomonas sp. ID1715]|uniref:efflux RND transporter permease subunit n=1 Tax=Sphingomonas sp. ID1715 TaxID=1656898 RepID=UPI001488AE8D|nr:efflux RND transporter permease subunit [Sphingomonas sp. ID1715]NNM77739.1 efflux RND transporter permease subunit [Sphingomonas sp. ID1715]